MKIKILSDLHLEFLGNQPQQYLKQIKYDDQTDVLVVAGDVGYPFESHYKQFFDFVSQHFSKTFVIAGNHEHYNSNVKINEMIMHLRGFFQKYNNITFLENNMEIYQGVTFIGTTLWSHISNPQYKINDTNMIHDLTVKEYNHYNERAVEYLDGCLSANKSKIVVITHHLPLDQLTDPKYKNPILLKYNQWFSNQLDKLVGKHQNKISCWIYGHTHMASDQSLNGMRYVCNPIGYPSENIGIKNFNKQIEI